MNKSLKRIQPPVLPVEKVVIPEVRTATLDNGVPVYVIEAGNEDVTRMEFVFRAGMVREHIPLLSSTTLMMLTEGTSSYSAEELNRLIDYYGAFLNFSPEKDLAGVTVFFLNRHAGKIMELISDIIFRPVFPEQELAAMMKKRQRWFMNNREKVSNLAIDQFFESVFGKTHPYGHQLKPDDFEKMEQTLVKDFHKEFYTPDNMTVILSGKTDTRAFKLLNEQFGSIIPSGTGSEKNRTIPFGERSREVHVNKPGAVQTAIRIGSSTINKRHPDYPGLKILTTILGGYFGSRLMKNIREEKGFTYGISSSVTSLDMAGYKVISTEVSPKNCKKTMDEIIREITLLQNQPLSADELDVIRNYMSGEMVRMFDGPFAIAESFRAAWEFGLDNNYYRNLSEKILKIDPDEIIHLARTYYKIDDLYRITAGP